MYNMALILVMLLGLASCTIPTDQDRFYPNNVLSLPYGFVRLSTVFECVDILRPLFWSNNIAVVYNESTTIFQSDVKNNDVIIMYRNEFYVNEELFNQIINFAINMQDNSDTVYYVGDVVELTGVAGLGSEHHLTITSVEMIGAAATTEGWQFPSILYEIKFEIYPSVTTENVARFFWRAESIHGHGDFGFTAINANTVHVRVLEGFEMTTIVVNNPTVAFSFDGLRRRIVVE